MFLALIIQHAKRMLRIIMWPVRLYHIFPHYLINGTVFGEKVTGHKICVLIFLQRLFETLHILRIIQ